MSELKTRRDVELEYEVREDGMIHSPGKFEGEMWYAPIVWGWMMEGMSDESIYDDDSESNVTDYFKVTSKDRKAFGLGAETYAFAVWESDQGFAYVEELTEEEYRDWTAPSKEDDEAD